MHIWVFSILFLVSLFTSSCKQSSQECTVREWKVLDLYRNTYPNVKDTVCNFYDSLFNGVNLPKLMLDSIYVNVRNNNTFFTNGLGSFEVLARRDIDFNGAEYKCAKIRFLKPGYNIDQEFLFWLVDAEIVIQQENEEKKLFLLKSNLKEGVLLNKESLVNEIMNDTVLFPPAPELK